MAYNYTKDSPENKNIDTTDIKLDVEESNKHSDMNDYERIRAKNGDKYYKKVGIKLKNTFNHQRFRWHQYKIIDTISKGDTQWLFCRLDMERVYVFKCHCF